MSEDPKILQLKAAASSNDPKIFYNALVDLSRSDKYRCLYSLDSQGMNLLEWTIVNDYWNTAHLLVYYAWGGVNLQLRKYTDQNPCVVPSLFWNQIMGHTVNIFHNTKQLRDPTISNEKLAPELQQRLNIYRKAQEMHCFNIDHDLNDQLLFVLLIRLGEDLTKKDSDNVPILFHMLPRPPPGQHFESSFTMRGFVRSVNWEQRGYSHALRFMATTHPLIGYTLRDHDNTCPLIYCLKNGRKDEFKALKTTEAFEKLAAEGLFAPFLTSNACLHCFTEPERTRLLLALSEEDLDLALNTALNEKFMSISLMTAVVTALKKGATFKLTSAMDPLHPFLAAYFVQHNVGDVNAKGLQVMRQRWSRNVVKEEWFSERQQFPLAQLPAEILILIARHLRADEILSLFLTTKSLHGILTSGSGLWQQQFLAKNMSFKPDSKNLNWRWAFTAQSRTRIKWRTGKLTRRREFKAITQVLHNQWALIMIDRELCARRWDDESGPLLEGKFPIVVFGTHMVGTPAVIDSTHNTITALVRRPNRRVEIGVLGTDEPVRSFTLPYYPQQEQGNDRTHFLRDEQHYVFGNRLNVMDLQTEQVVTRLDYDVLQAKSNYFDSSTILAHYIQNSTDTVLLIDDTSRVLCNIPVRGNMRDFHMVNEHHVFCVADYELRYYDIRYPAQSIPLLEMESAGSLAFDVPNQRMTLCTNTHASVMTFDLSTMTWDRVFLAPEAVGNTYQYYNRSYVYDKYLAAGSLSNLNVYEMVYNK